MFNFELPDVSSLETCATIAVVWGSAELYDFNIQIREDFREYRDELGIVLTNVGLKRLFLGVYENPENASKQMRNWMEQNNLSNNNFQDVKKVIERHEEAITKKGFIFSLMPEGRLFSCCIKLDLEIVNSLQKEHLKIVNK